MTPRPLRRRRLGLGALERVLPRRARRRAGRARRRLGVPVRRAAAQPARPGRARDPVARDPVRPGNSDLCFRWDGPIEDAVAHSARTTSRSSSGPVARAGARGDGHERLLPRPGRSLLEFISYGWARVKGSRAQADLEPMTTMAYAQLMQMEHRMRAAELAEAINRAERWLARASSSSPPSRAANSAAPSGAWLAPAEVLDDELLGGLGRYTSWAPRDAAGRPQPAIRVASSSQGATRAAVRPTRPRPGAPG